MVNNYYSKKNNNNLLLLLCIGILKARLHIALFMKSLTADSFTWMKLRQL